MSGSRFSIPEKRPFFLDGLELFDTPNQLIYTRRIVAPRGGLKLAGNVGGTNVAVDAVQDDDESFVERRPAIRCSASRAFAGISGANTPSAQCSPRARTATTTRASLPLISACITRSSTSCSFRQRSRGPTASAENTNGSLLQADWDRTGRAWGFHYTLRAIEPGFSAAAGFVNRTGFVEARTFNRLSFYGAKGALVQTYGTFVQATRRGTIPSGPAADRDHRVAQPVSYAARRMAAERLESRRSGFAYDAADYGGLSVSPWSRRHEPPSHVPGFEDDQYSGSFRVTTPTLQFISATAGVGLMERHRSSARPPAVAARGSTARSISDPRRRFAHRFSSRASPSIACTTTSHSRARRSRASRSNTR